MTNDTCGDTEVVEIRRKRPPSDAPSAVRMRRHRQLRKRRKMVVQVAVSERDLDALERAGYLDPRLMDDLPTAIIASALALLDVPDSHRK